MHEPEEDTSSETPQHEDSERLQPTQYTPAAAGYTTTTTTTTPPHNPALQARPNTLSIILTCLLVVSLGGVGVLAYLAFKPKTCPTNYVLETIDDKAVCVPKGRKRFCGATLPSQYTFCPDGTEPACDRPFYMHQSSTQPTAACVPVNPDLIPHNLCFVAVPEYTECPKQGSKSVHLVQFNHDDKKFFNPSDPTSCSNKNGFPVLDRYDVPKEMWMKGQAPEMFKSVFTQCNTL